MKSRWLSPGPHFAAGHPTHVLTAALPTLATSQEEVVFERKFYYFLKRASPQMCFYFPPESKMWAVASEVLYFNLLKVCTPQIKSENYNIELWVLPNLITWSYWSSCPKGIYPSMRYIVYRKTQDRATENHCKVV